jgi:hypothetical protein
VVDSHGLHDGSARFTAALEGLAQDLDTEAHPIDYRRRRQSLQGWSLASEPWGSIIAELPPVPAPVRPDMDDRKRQDMVPALTT